MKTIICKCFQCREVRKRSKKANRVQTAQVRAARSRAHEQLKTLPIDMVDGTLPEVVLVDYYA